MTPTEKLYRRYMKDVALQRVTRYFFVKNMLNKSRAARDLYNYLVETQVHPRSLRGCEVVMGMHPAVLEEFYRNNARDRGIGYDDAV